MFNNNKKKKSGSTVNTNATGNNLPSVNMISEGTKVKGNLDTKNDVRIAGKLEGEAKAKGKLIVSSTGEVDGDVRSADADIAGQLKGEIHVSNKLILRKSARVDGDIYTKSLLVEEGAQLNGSCHMNEEDSKELTSRKSSSAKNSSDNKPGSGSGDSKSSGDSKTVTGTTTSKT